MSAPQKAPGGDKNPVHGDRVMETPNATQPPLGLAERPCWCGPARAKGQNLVCITCARYASIGKKTAARAPHLNTERRTA